MDYCGCLYFLSSMNNLQLVLVCGISGSGKSTYAKVINKENEFILLSSDAFRAVLGRDENDQTVSAKAFEYLKNNARYFLKQGRSVIIDATSTYPKSRRDFVDIGREFGAVVVAYCMDIPIEVCKERNAARERVVPDFVIQNQANRLAFPTLEEFDIIYFVDKNQRIAKMLNKSKFYE